MRKRLLTLDESWQLLLRIFREESRKAGMTERQYARRHLSPSRQVYLLSDVSEPGELTPTCAEYGKLRAWLVELLYNASQQTKSISARASAMRGVAKKTKKKARLESYVKDQWARLSAGNIPLRTRNKTILKSLPSRWKAVKVRTIQDITKKLKAN
jgi:hypothetical protein